MTPSQTNQPMNNETKETPLTFKRGWEKVWRNIKSVSVFL